MKFAKLIFIMALFLGASVTSVNAKMMMGRFSNSAADWNEVVEHTVREEREGQALWQKLQATEISCDDLTRSQFGVLGEYFMGQMTGDSHAAMNAMMIGMHGEEGEEQIHIVLGKRLSGCDTSAAVAGIESGWMPVMNMMMGGWSPPLGFNPTNDMMSFGYGVGFFGWIFMILWWVLIVAALAALLKWLIGRSPGGGRGKSALDILKERYAKGEINKQEFEEKKRDLV